MSATEVVRRVSAWLLALSTVAVLLFVDNIHWLLTRLHEYNALHRNHAWYYAESIDKVAGVVLCIAVVWCIRREGLSDVLGELGLTAAILPALGFALVCSAPMLVGFAITRHFSPGNSMLPMFFLTVFAPIAEEIEYRGFGVRQFQRGTGWPFWLVVWPAAIIFAWGHVEQGASWDEKFGIFVITGAGAVVFAWLLQQWQNLWFPIMLHITMNLWWELFSVARTAVGGWFPFALQSLTMLLAIIVTLLKARNGPLAQAENV